MKKNLRRLISLAMAVFMALSLMPAAFAASAGDFGDVPSGAWYYDSVEYVVSHKYFEGTGDNKFSPLASMTRAMFVTVLSRIAGVETDDNVSPFADVESGAWYSGEVAWAAENKLASGTGNNKFSPNQSVTRGDMAAFMAKFVSYYCEKNDLSPPAAGAAKTFTDGDKIPSYARDAVALCATYGIIDGYTDGSFKPSATATRAEVAAVIRRLDILLGSDESNKKTEKTPAVTPVPTPDKDKEVQESSENNAVTAADFKSAAEKEALNVTATITNGKNFTVNDDVTITNKTASKLILNLGEANLGDLVINAHTAGTVEINGTAASLTSLTVNAPNASVTNRVTVNGPVDIQAVSGSTFINMAKTGTITMSGSGAVEDKYECADSERAPIVIATSEPVTVKGKSTEISVVSDEAKLALATDKDTKPKVESTAAKVNLTVSTEGDVTIAGTVNEVTTTAAKPSLTVDGTVAKIQVADTVTEKPELTVKGTGTVAAMETGKADLKVEAETLSVEKVTAGDGGSITAPENTVAEVEAKGNVTLDAKVDTVTAESGVTLNLTDNASVKALEAKGDLNLGGGGEVISIDAKAADATIAVKEDATVAVAQVTATTASAAETIKVTGLTDVNIVTKAPRPTGVGVIQPTEAEGAGKITGVDETMEYMNVAGTDGWKKIAGSEIELPAGTYRVRVAESGTTLAGEAVTVTIDRAVGVSTCEIQGTAYVGNTLTATANADATGTVKYTWTGTKTVNGEAAETALGEGRTLTLTDNHVGMAITVKVSNYPSSAVTKSLTGIVTADKAPLAKLLDKAEEVRKGVTVKDAGTAANRVAEGVIFVTETEEDDLDTAVNTAKGTYTGTAAITKADLDKVEDNLRNAINDFIADKKVGTATGADFLWQDLQTLIGTAPDPEAVATAADAQDVKPGVQWITATDKTAYTYVLDNAKNLTAQSGTEALSGAITALNDAVTAYLGNIRKGAALDGSSLTAAVNAAELNAVSVDTSVNGKDVLPSRTWVTADKLTAYNAAILKAKTLTAVKQRDYTNALGTLNTATEEFNKVKSAGSKDITPPSVTEVTALRTGTTALVTFTVNETGSYTYKVGSSAATAPTEINTAGKVSFSVEGYDKTANPTILVTVSDKNGNTTQFTVLPSASFVKNTRTGETYETLAEAVGAAENGDTVKLLRDLTGSVTVVVDKTITLDLNGKTISSTVANNKAAVRVTGTAAQLTITDSGTGGKIVAGDKNYGIYAENGGIAIVNSGTIESGYSALTGNNTTGNMNFAVNGGTLTAKFGPAIYMPGQVSLNVTGGTLNGGISLRMGQVNISGGTINAIKSNIDSPGEYYNYSGNAWFPDALYVLGGTYTSEDATYGNSLKLNITGGTFNCENNEGSAVAIYDLGMVAQAMEVSISGSAVLTTQSSERSAYQVLKLTDIKDYNTKKSSGYNTEGLVGKVNTSITGGTFSSDPTAYLGSESVSEEVQGQYVVRLRTAADSDAAATVGGKYYATLASAIDGAKDGETVTLLGDITEEDVKGAAIKYDLTGKTLDLNGYTYSQNNYAHIFYGTGGTIKNGKMVSLNGGYTDGTNGSYALFIGSSDVSETKGFTVEDVQLTGGINVYNNATDVTLKDLTVHGTRAYAVWAGKDTRVTIKSGTYTSDSSATWSSKSILNAGSDDKDYSGKSLITVEGGTFTCKDGQKIMGTAASTGALTITGGTFSVDPTSYLAQGYKAENTSGDSGAWTVSKKIYSDYPANPADVTEMPAGVEIVDTGNNTFTITLKDEEAFLYFTQVFDVEKAYEARKAAGEAGTITKYDSERNGTNLNMWYATSGITIKMGCDVDLKGMTVSTAKLVRAYGPIFDGCGHTVKNGKIEASSGYAGFFGGNIRVSNMTFDNFTVSANGCEGAAVVFGYVTGAKGVYAPADNLNIDDVTVKNSTVTGAKYTGAIVGWGNGNINVTNCKVEDTVVCGQYKVGGAVGFICGCDVKELNLQFTGNILTNVTVKGENIWSGKENDGFKLGKIVGNWCVPNGTCKNNTFTGTTEATGNIGQKNSVVSIDED